MCPIYLDRTGNERSSTIIKSNEAQKIKEEIEVGLELCRYSINSDTWIQLLFKISPITSERFGIRLQLVERVLKVPLCTLSSIIYTLQDRRRTRFVAYGI